MNHHPLHLPEVVVIGGANMDLHARAAAPIVPGSSNPGTAELSPGGVGRNIAENLARLGTSTALISAVGDDPIGDDVLAHTADAGVDVSLVRRRPLRTGTYNAILDASGELVVAVSDMAATDEISPLVVQAAREMIVGARGLIVEGNLPLSTLEVAFALAAEADVPIAFDPVSVPKARRCVGLLRPDRPVCLVSPDREELAVLTGWPAGTDTEVVAAARSLHERGVELVWVRLGARGSLFSGPDGCEFLPAISVHVLDVTGAGDSMLAAFVHALLREEAPLAAARYGHAAAGLTCTTDHTVHPDLTDELVRSLL